MMRKLLASFVALMAMAALAYAALGEGKLVNPPLAPLGHHHWWQMSQPVVTPPTFVPPTGGGGGGTPFALPMGDVLHYLAPNGNDACNGTSPTIGTSGNCAWLTPNHALNCGDVIIAAAGAHNQQFQQWGTVSNCPSTTGGIDGIGGIQAAILLCAASDLGTSGCVINCATASCAGGIAGSGGRAASPAMMNVNHNNWAIIGFNGTPNGPSHRGFQLDGCLTTTTIVHHVFFINIALWNGAQAFDTDDCGYSSNVPGNGGDYMAVVGSIAQNAAQDAICLAAIDFVGPASIDANAGTHHYAYGNFVWGGVAPLCSSAAWVTGRAYTAGCTTTPFGTSGWCGTYAVSNGNLYILTSANCTSGATAPSGMGTGISDGACTWNFVLSGDGNSDVEAMMLDSPDVHGFSGQVVFANNVAWGYLRECIQIFDQRFNAATLTVKIYNNTCYNNLRGTGADFLDGEINLQVASGHTGVQTVTLTTFQNITLQTNATSPGGTSGGGNLGGGRINAMNNAFTPNSGTSTTGGTGIENIFKANQSSCAATACDATFNTSAWNGLSVGTNFYVDPAYSNLTDLNANWGSANVPNCTGFATVTACMGYNVATTTLTSNTPIADLTATCSQCGGKGYQLPSATCNTNADYPAYLKGIVRLQWNSGSQTITQMHDLVTTPCGL